MVDGDDIVTSEGGMIKLGCASLFSVRARERASERWDKCLEVKKMKENENPETSEGFLFLFYFMGRVGLNLRILFLG